MKKTLNYGLAICALVAAGVLGTSSANASVITETWEFRPWDPTQLNESCFAAGYPNGSGCLIGQTNGGTVTVTDDGSGSLTYDVELANGNKFLTQSYVSFGFHLAGLPTITYSFDASQDFIIPGGNPQSPYPHSGACQLDNTCSLHLLGFYQYGVNQPDGSSLKFTISDLNNDLDISDVNLGNTNEYFSAWITSGTTGNHGGIGTGPWAGVIQSDVDPVPAPGNTLGLLGIGMIGTAGAVGWNRRRRQSQFAV